MEFIYNNSKHSFTRISPFYVLYSYNLALLIDPAETEESINIMVKEQLQILHNA